MDDTARKLIQSQILAARHDEIFWATKAQKIDSKLRLARELAGLGCWWIRPYVWGLQAVAGILLPFYGKRGDRAYRIKMRLLEARDGKSYRPWYVDPEEERASMESPS